MNTPHQLQQEHVTLKPKRRNPKISKAEHNEQHSSDSEQGSDTSQEHINPPTSPESLKPSIQFGDTAIQMKCPFCLQNIRTQIILKPQFVSILFGFTLFIMIPHFVTIVITIIALQLTATRKHRCPLCERELGTDGKFLLFFKDQVYSFAMGANGVIVSKKIVTTAIMVLILFVFLTIKVNNAYADVQWTDLTWQQFIRQCPPEEMSDKCRFSNEGLTVKNWKGFVMRVQDNRNSFRRHFQHAVSIFIKMNDPRTLELNRQKPDLLLTINTYQAHIWQETLDKLFHGDQLVFNGTFRYLRNNRGIPIGRHLNIIEMNKTANQNNNLHVYMSDQDDMWFFGKMSGDKLRKHEEGQLEVVQLQVMGDQGQVNQQKKQKQVYKEAQKIAQERKDPEKQTNQPVNNNPNEKK